MQRKILVLILFSFATLFACSQHKPDIQYTVKQDSYQNTDFKTWQIGQWSRYQTSSISRDGMFRLFGSDISKGELQLLVAAVQDDGYWLEFKDKNQGKEQPIAALIVVDKSNGYLDYKIKELKLTEDEEQKHFYETELIEGEADEEQEMVKSWLNFIVYSLHKGVYRNVQLPAGQFLAVKEVPMTLSLRLGQMSGYLWYHNAVPIFPVAKFEFTTGTSQWFTTTESVELVDFGSVGQQNYFLYE